jgi:hypothetical protein
MDAAQFFMLRYEPLHATMTDRLLVGLSDAQLRARPHGQNSIVWLLWHVARAENIGINRFAMDGREVFDEGGWTSRLGAGRREVGTAMTSDEVSDLTARVSIPALGAYWIAVGQRTVDIIRAHGAAGWEQAVDPGLVRRVVRDEGDFGPHVNPDVVESYYAGMTRGWAFAQMALTHTWGHFFEGNVVRSMTLASGSA